MWGYVVPWLCVVVVLVHAGRVPSIETTAPSVYNASDSTTNGSDSHVTDSDSQSTPQTQPNTGSALSSTRAVTTNVINTKSSSVMTPGSSLTSAVTPRSTQQNIVSTTAKSTFAWNHVAFGLIGIIAVLIIALIITVICTYKLKQKLKQCSKTLYPIVPGQDGPNEYLDLDVHHVGKHGNVQLTKMDVHHEEEFDTPALPTTPLPPTKPSRQLNKPPPPPPISDLPSQRNLKEGIPVPPKRKSKNNGNVKQDQNGGQLNQGFEPGSKFPGMNANNMYDHDDDLYEDYDENLQPESKGRPPNMFENESETEEPMEEQLTYEEPVTKSSGRQVLFTDDGMRRQDSSTGLPDVPSRFTTGAQQRQSSVPLGMTEDDTFGSTDFDQSGIPLSAVQFDDPQFFGDLDANEPHDNFDMGEVENRDSFVDIPNHNYHILEKESPDYDLNKHQTGVVKAQELTDDFTSEVVAYNNETEEPGLYENNAFGLTKLKEVVPEQNAVHNIDTTDGIYKEEIKYENTILPAIPPRRDIERKQSESEAAAANLVTVFEDKNKPSPTHSFDENQPESEVVLRSGKNIRGPEVPRDSYFLDVADKTILIKDGDGNPMSVEPEMDAVSDLDPNGGLKNINSSVNESQPGNLISEMSNPSAGDYMNAGDQLDSEMLVDYDNFTNINGISNSSNFTSDPFDMFNGTVPHQDHVANSGDVNDENGAIFE